MESGVVVVTSENQKTLDLLRQVLPSPRWDGTDFLDWVYDHNPTGPLVPFNVDLDGRRVCHIGGVPVPLRNGELDGVGLLLLNSSTAPDEQQKGTYAKAIRAIAELAGEQGMLGVFGVTNADSTGPALRGAKGSWQCSLPVRLCVPWRPPIGVRSHDADPQWLAGDEFATLTRRLDRQPARDLTCRWSTDLLRWRLLTPGTRYAVHWNDALVAVTTRTVFRGVPITIVLKLLPREGRTGPLTPQPHITAACRHHRTPLALYAGVNVHVPVSGIRLSQERLPAPLNLVMISSRPDLLAQHRFVFDAFEFLDFDAY